MNSYESGFTNGSKEGYKIGYDAAINDIELSRSSIKDAFNDFQAFMGRNPDQHEYLIKYMLQTRYYFHGYEHTGDVLIMYFPAGIIMLTTYNNLQLFYK